MIKKTFTLLVISFVSVCCLFAFDIKVGAGVQYKPIDCDLLSQKSLSEKDSWNLCVNSQYNWKYFGFVTDVTFDYISSDYSYFTIDAGFDGRVSIGRSTFSLGVLLPFTINNWKFGLDDIALSTIPYLVKSERLYNIFYSTRIFGEYDFDITDKISTGIRYAYIAGKATNSGTWLSEIISSGRTGYVNLFATYKVL